jgi:preprotein translocase subunit SecE
LRVRVLPGLPVGNAVVIGGVLPIEMSKRSVHVADDKKQNRITRYFREMTGELRKVNWPTWPEARQLTIIVIVVMFVMGVYLSIVDLIGEALINLAISA